MSFGTRLKEKREALGITQPQLAELLNVSKGAIGNWETDVNSPRAALLYDIFKILHCDANYLFQDETRELYKDAASPEEFEYIIKKYRNLDDFGRETVDTTLERETKRVTDIRAQQKQLQAQQERINALETEQQEISKKLQTMRAYTYFGEIACAGSGFYFDEIPTETIEAPDMGGDFIIGVNGDSMEPDYHNGDKLYVKKTEHISHGDVGIFTIGNECFLKEFGEDGLISRNKDYDNIPGTEDLRLIGKVIGKVKRDI